MTEREQEGVDEMMKALGFIATDLRSDNPKSIVLMGQHDTTSVFLRQLQPEGVEAPVTALGLVTQPLQGELGTRRVQALLLPDSQVEFVQEHPEIVNCADANEISKKLSLINQLQDLGVDADYWAGMDSSVLEGILDLQKSTADLLKGIPDVIQEQALDLPEDIRLELDSARVSLSAAILPINWGSLRRATMGSEYYDGLFKARNDYMQAVVHATQRVDDAAVKRQIIAEERSARILDLNEAAESRYKRTRTMRFSASSLIGGALGLMVGSSAESFVDPSKAPLTGSLGQILVGGAIGTVGLGGLMGLAMKPNRKKFKHSANKKPGELEQELLLHELEAQLKEETDLGVKIARSLKLL